MLGGWKICLIHDTLMGLTDHSLKDLRVLSSILSTNLGTKSRFPSLVQLWLKESL